MFGYCMDVREVLGCADVSVFPSRREGLGMAGLEALAMEIPLLAAENRGTREYLKPGINGYFCESDSVSSWINGLETIRNLAPDVRQEMKRMCRKSAEVFGKENILYSKGCDILGEENYIDDAVKIAEKADVVVCVIGDCLAQNGEYRDRATLNYRVIKQNLSNV